MDKPTKQLTKIVMLLHFLTLDLRSVTTEADIVELLNEREKITRLIGNAKEELQFLQKYYQTQETTTDTV